MVAPSTLYEPSHLPTEGAEDGRESAGRSVSSSTARPGREWPAWRERVFPITEEIRRVLALDGRLAVDVSSLGDDDDLYQAGLTSHSVVRVMLALEDQFDVEFPEHMLRNSTFESIGSIREALAELLAPGSGG
jgi:acyl carrier protein